MEILEEADRLSLGTAIAASIPRKRTARISSTSVNAVFCLAIANPTSTKKMATVKL